MSFIVVTYGWAAFGLESDSSTYIGIFPLVLNWSWMCKCHPFPISKWRNSIRLMLCLGTSSLAHRKISTIDWKGCWICLALHWKTMCACTSQWFARCAGRCCTAWLGHVAQPRFRRSPLLTRSNQNKADRCLTHSRWSVRASPWRAHVTQRVAHWVRSLALLLPSRSALMQSHLATMNRTNWEI
jgi:hypothetical protein